MKWSLLTFLITKKAHLHMHTLKYTFYEDFCNVSVSYWNLIHEKPQNNVLRTIIAVVF